MIRKPASATSTSRTSMIQVRGLRPRRTSTVVDGNSSATGVSISSAICSSIAGDVKQYAGLLLLALCFSCQPVAPPEKDLAAAKKVWVRPPREPSSLVHPHSKHRDFPPCSLRKPCV